MIDINHTHDALAQSWVASANLPGTDFPIQNLPLGVFQVNGADSARIGVAIGDQILDLAAALDQGLLPRLQHLEPVLRSDTLNALMAGGEAHSRLLRHAVFELLEAGSDKEGAARAC